MIQENKPHIIELDGQAPLIEYCGTYEVKPGVDCETYRFIGDDTKDLAIIHVQPACKTPLQRVLTGLRTFEQYLSGQGQLIVATEGRPDEVHTFCTGTEQCGVEVSVGQTVQWVTGDEGLVYAEVCEPPYQEDRFENLDQ